MSTSLGPLKSSIFILCENSCQKHRGSCTVRRAKRGWNGFERIGMTLTMEKPPLSRQAGCNQKTRWFGKKSKLSWNFPRNAERMRYAELGSQGLAAGSGVVAAGCKTDLIRTPMPVPRQKNRRQIFELGCPSEEPVVDGDRSRCL
jgi:hypothetical protein